VELLTFTEPINSGDLTEPILDPGTHLSMYTASSLYQIDLTFYLRAAARLRCAFSHNNQLWLTFF